MTEITLERARSIARGAIRYASDRGVAGATVVVTDGGGFVRVAERSDAAPAFGVDIAIAKARSALGFGQSTRALAAAFGDKPSVIAAVTAAVGSAFLAIGGGVIVVDAEGRTIGAVAATGGPPDIDHDAVVTALADVGLACIE